VGTHRISTTPSALASQKHRDTEKQRQAERIKQDTFLQTILSMESFADKVEAIRAVNPYFYLLTPKPKKHP
jgi:hypothetical protein